ncbi:hypothetical protein HOY82DRAFT_611705 [Tuber indicum]|nr:hypothetical protein HOY82DRAFT_611705 [Tuber indicum]
MSNNHHVPRSTTTLMAKRGQILAYTMLRGNGGRKMKFARDFREDRKFSGNLDLCATENLEPKPNALKGSQQCITKEEKAHLVAITLSDGDHCQMTYGELALAETGRTLSLQMSPTLKLEHCVAVM